MTVLSLGAVAVTWNVLSDLNGTTAKATLDLFNQLKVASGGFCASPDDCQSATETCAAACPWCSVRMASSEVMC